MISGCIMNHNSSSSTGLRKSIEQLTTWTIHGREAEIARQRSSSHLRRHCVVCSRWPGGLMPENRGWKTNHGSLPTCGVGQGASMITAVRYSLSRIVTELFRIILPFVFTSHQGEIHDFQGNWWRWSKVSKCLLFKWSFRILKEMFIVVQPGLQ